MCVTTSMMLVMKSIYIKKQVCQIAQQFHYSSIALCCERIIHDTKILWLWGLVWQVRNNAFKTALWVLQSNPEGKFHSQLYQFVSRTQLHGKHIRARSKTVGVLKTLNHKPNPTTIRPLHTHHSTNMKVLHILTFFAMLFYASAVPRKFQVLPHRRLPNCPGPYNDFYPPCPSHHVYCCPQEHLINCVNSNGLGTAVCKRFKLKCGQVEHTSSGGIRCVL